MKIARGCSRYYSYIGDVATVVREISETRWVIIA